MSLNGGPPRRITSASLGVVVVLGYFHISVQKEASRRRDIMRGLRGSGRSVACHISAKTTMPRWPPPFPPEIFDLIIDHLQDEPITLKACCLVSKSWVPRSRMHIFAHVEFDPVGTPVESCSPDRCTYLGPFLPPRPRTVSENLWVERTSRGFPRSFERIIAHPYIPPPD